MQIRFEDDVTDDAVAAEEFVDEEDYLTFMNGFRVQVCDTLYSRSRANINAKLSSFNWLSQALLCM